MRMLLDTNVFLWVLAGSDRISKVRDLILADETEVFVSVASFWEIAIKHTIGKLALDVPEARCAAIDSGFHELPVLGAHTEALSKLPLLHRDPFDRLLVAQAIVEPMRLMTGDGSMAQYSELVMRI
ncbi:type II toxin-antitoxin system VapC family toxin [Trinickia mobilis]|uniref:type II toxin-antitoxin system VapC family toxin n=1 Tax=Trinickia mobilis TaxID=2816356 RepID=UPI001A8C0773|nr:type II toxin-antitoxin system VapC family toxin [Trinickia mobilis]